MLSKDNKSNYENCLEKLIIVNIRSFKHAKHITENTSKRKQWSEHKKRIFISHLLIFAFLKWVKWLLN